MPIPPHAARRVLSEPGLLPGELELLVQRSSLTEALDAGLVQAATESGDPRALLRVARWEQMAGRDDAARERLTALAAAGDPAVARGCRVMLELDRYWTRDPCAPAEPPAGADDEPVALLELSSAVLHRLNLDGDGTGIGWAEVQRLVERAATGADAWLRGAAPDAARLAEGVDAGIYAAAVGFLSERIEWSADFMARLRRAVQRHRLRVWQPYIDFFEGSALSALGDFDRARRLVRRATAGLRRDPAAPWRPMALAGEYYLASLSSGIPPFDITAMERELVTGVWRMSRPTFRQSVILVLGQGVAALGDPAGAVRLLAEEGPLEALNVPHEDRVFAYEAAFLAALGEGRRDEAGRWLDRMGRLLGSATRDAALARMRLLLDDEQTDPVAPATSSGVAASLIRARLALIAAALARGDRGQALGELAELEALATRLRASAVQVRAVRLFRPAIEGTPLSERQLEVATLAAAGLSNRQIAEQLFLSPRTVESHLRSVLRSLGLRRRSQLADAALPAELPGDWTTHRASLTVRQGQVAALIAAGCTNAEIARVLGITDKAVERHVGVLKRSLGVPNRTAIATAFVRSGA